MAAAYTHNDKPNADLIDLIQDIGIGGPADCNGDDNIALLAPDGSIIDMFGVPGEDGSGTGHEFEDGRAERACSSTLPTATWQASDWNIDNDSGGGNGPQYAPADFDPFSWVCLGLSISGCTDPTADNYDSTATVDDGSCVTLIVDGCTDPLYVEFNSAANNDDGSCLTLIVDGCTDPTADNYNPSANNDDGTCSYTTAVCANSPITGLSISDIIDTRVVANFDNMNTYDANGTQICRVDQLRIKYREVGTTTWSQKNMGSPTGYDATTGICNSSQRTDKPIMGLTAGTTYEWQMRVWYCGTGATAWVTGPNFTTANTCPIIGNLTAYGATPTKATFDWDASNGAYAFVRLKARVDSISNVTVSDWFLIGGAGVTYGTNTKDKNGLTPGQTYRAQGRTYCDPNGGAWRSPVWTPLVYWTQPVVRVEGGTAIANLDVYPNPSRDLFNVTFTSEDVQDLEVRVINVVGEVVYTENLQQFVGEYTKSLDLESYTKGVYFLEITTNNGVVNKKLILQ